MNRPARIASTILGILLILFGVLFGGQGLGYLPGSAMTGDRMWFYIGSVMVVVGIVLVALAVRGRRRIAR